MAVVRRTREQWELLVAELACSGLSVAEFAGSRRLNPRTVSWWRWRLEQGPECGRSTPSGGAIAGTGGEVSLENVVHFVPVAVEGWSSVPAASSGAVEVALPGGVRLRFDHPLDVAGLRALASAFGVAGAP